MCKENIDDWSLPTSSACIGAGSADQHLATLAKTWASMTDKVDADISGWDWSVQGFDLDIDLELRLDRFDASKALTHICRSHWHVLKYKVFQLADGALYAQTLPGVQPSGRFCTSDTNSRCRAFNALYVGSKLPRTMGDDSVETYVKDAIAKYAALGKTLKFYSRVDDKDHISFCSRQWPKLEDGTYSPNAWLETWVKSVYRLLSFKSEAPADNALRYIQLRYELRHNDPTHMELVDRLITATGWGGENFLDNQFEPFIPISQNTPCPEEN